MKHIKKTRERPLKRIRGLLNFAVSRYIKNPPQRNLYDLPGILYSDLKPILPEGTGFCLCCGKALEPEEIGLLVITNGRYRFCCLSTICQQSLQDTV